MIDFDRNPHYEPRTTEEVVDDLEYHVDAGHRSFYLIAEAIPPRHCGQIANEIVRRGLDLRWTSFVRVDRGFDVDTLAALKASGFRGGTLGLESSNSRLLALINKGYCEDDARELLTRLRAAGLALASANIILDIPTTTFAEARAVYAFCDEFSDVVDEFSTFYFRLLAPSTMGKDPGRFGITLTPGRRAPAEACHEGHPGALAYRDPAGMSRRQKREVRAMYFALNERLRRRREFDGALASLLDAPSPAAVEDYECVFAAPTEYLFGAVSFSPSGRRYRGGSQPAAFRLSAPRLLKVRADFARILRDLAGKTLSIKGIAEYLSGEFDAGDGHQALRLALTFAQICGEHGLLQTIRRVVKQHWAPRS